MAIFVDVSSLCLGVWIIEVDVCLFGFLLQVSSVIRGDGFTYFLFSMTGRRWIEQRRRYRAHENTIPTGSTLWSTSLMSSWSRKARSLEDCQVGDVQRYVL